MKIRKAVLLVLVPGLLLASEPVTIDWYSASYKYNLASASLIYCTGGKWRPGFGTLITSGSSTTTTDFVATQDSFDAVAVGDIIMATGLIRQVTAKASADSITVDSAWDLGTAGVGWQFISYSCGTAATDGWLPSGTFHNNTYTLEITTLNATSIDVRLECRSAAPGAAPVPVYPSTSGSGDNCAGGTHTGGFCNFTSATGAALAVRDVGEWNECRWGMKINTDTGTQAITAYSEGKK